MTRIGEDCYFFKLRQWLLNRKARKVFRHFGLGSQFRPGAYAAYPENIVIGQNVVIRPGCRLFSDDKSWIHIGDNVLLGHNVHIYTNDHDLKNNSYKYGNVIVGSNCWIGANTTILQGSVIEDGAIVGAGSVVKSRIPRNEVWAGCPAKRIK